MGNLVEETDQRELELLSEAVTCLARVDDIVAEIEGLNEGGRRAAAYLGSRFDDLVEQLAADVRG